jgi:probable F420-dependent oxidoreductase
MDVMPATHLPNDQAAIPGYPALAKRLEDGGYDGLWIGEVNDIDAVTATALAATGTTTAAVGVLLNTFTRAPTTLAMTASTLARLAPGRMHVVLGVASPLLVQRWNGIPYERAFARLRDVLRFVRAALEGGRVAGPFATFVTDGFALPSPPPEPPALLVAACGPRALQLAAAEADGVVLNWATPDDVERIDPLPDDRAKVSVVFPVCPSTDPDVVDALMRPIVADYLNAPAYAEQQRRLGRAPALEPVWEAWAAGDRRGARARLPRDVLDQLVISGSHADCRRQLTAVERATGGRAIAAWFPPPGMSFDQAALA